MAVKKIAFNIFSAFLAVAIVLINWTSCCVLRLLRSVCNKSYLANHINARWLKVMDSGKREIIEYLQILINLAIGVLFGKTLLEYHSFLVETMVTITYQLHLLSLNWAVDLPDYSAYLKGSEAVRMVTVLLYLLFGCIGLSAQISFTLDLISVFSYPFRAMHRFCDWACNELVKLKDTMINILTIKKKYWVTCPYPEYLLNDTFKIVYICALPLVFYLIFLTKAYSLFMAALVLVFKTIIRIGANLSLLVEEAGRVVCTLLGVDVEGETLCYDTKTVMERVESAVIKLRNVEWISVCNWKKMKDNFQGSEV